MEKLRTFINKLSPEQRESFAMRCGTSIGYLRKAISDGQEFNPITCVKIENETSSTVTRQDLRPDDWMKIWPELAEKKAA